MASSAAAPSPTPVPRKCQNPAPPPDNELGCSGDVLLRSSYDHGGWWTLPIEYEYKKSKQQQLKLNTDLG
jgi:hypothetical protein